MVVFFGVLHIKMAATKTLGDWLRRGGWAYALVQADIATPGTADSFSRAAHLTRTRRPRDIAAPPSTPCVQTPLWDIFDEAEYPS